MGTAKLVYVAILASLCILPIVCNKLVSAEPWMYEGGPSFGLEIESQGGQNCDTEKEECGVNMVQEEFVRKRQRPVYISYRALEANRVMCPPRSGRSYYTLGCHHEKGKAVNPYYRACSVITRCYRSTQ
ncbi:hypothetical protein SUGI_0663940 [Cryptomeria japonica]|uniref:protein RALF-like 34 n=1 Tax=Cryptomeria japonica TaxID=3369 RepID=UPI002414B839|nr:protein RALF-like 34 [Cryptomeria japonica]GLJ32971.1 hypothetical protein SUGI_0663940 [Cryptomeria japonica]